MAGGSKITLDDGEFSWGPAMCEIGDESRHITSYYHVLPYFWGRLLAFVGLLSGERLPFSCVLGVKYAVVVENLVQQFPSPSSVKMDHCNSAVKPVLIDVVKSLSIRWICMPCICSFWGHSQTWLREQKVQETPTSGP